MSTAVIVLAAGKGTRMKSNTPKVLHKIAGREMLGHVIHAGLGVNPEKNIVIYSANEVADYATNNFPNVVCLEQKEQLGTAHAVLPAEETLKGFKGDVLILNGDVPLMDQELIERFVESHRAQKHDVTFISVFAEDPTGLGRVVRDENEEVVAIVEHKDANEEQLKIDEINTGIYIAKSDVLFKLLNQVSNNNAQGEYYITDIIALGLKNGHLVGTFTAEDAESLGGVNSRFQLAMSEDMFQNRKREEFMDNGVTFIDPQSVFFAFDTVIENDVEIGPNVQFASGVKVESGATIEGNLFIKDSIVRGGASIKSFSHIEGADIQTGATVGPFARLRTGSNVGQSAKVGSFVEVKNSSLGTKTSAGHLSYIGDANIGDHVNIGAGTVVANYDGANKHKTNIGNNVFIGSGTTLVAPVTIGEGSTTAANSIITKDVAANTLVVSKVNRIERTDFVRPSKNK